MTPQPTYVQFNRSLWHLAADESLEKTACGRAIPEKHRATTTTGGPATWNGVYCYECSRSKAGQKMRKVKAI